MQITHQADYALRAILYLSRLNEKQGEMVATSKIAQNVEFGLRNRKFQPPF